MLLLIKLFPTWPGVKLEDLAAFDRSGHPHNQVRQGGNLGKNKVWREIFGSEKSEERHLLVVDIERLGLPVGSHLLLTQVEPGNHFAKLKTCVLPFLPDQEGNLKDWDLKDENPLFPVPSLPPSTFSTLNTGPYFFGFSKIDMFKV